MKQVLTTIMLVFSQLSFAQGEVKSIDFVKILNNNQEEARYYFENNWKILRENAIKKDYIKSYDYAEVKNSSGNEFDIMLITTYKNQAQADARENNFAELIKERGETKLLNQKKSNEFRKIVYSQNMIVSASTNPEEEAVKKVIVDAYFKGNFNEADSSAMAKGFHPEFAFYYPEAKGTLGKMPIKEWKNIVAKRRADPVRYAQRTDWVCEIKSIDLTGHAASVKVEIRNKGKLTYTDYLQLLKFDIGWRIVGKVFYGHP